MSKLKITKKHLISKAFVNVNVNIVGEYSGISEDAAQEYLERMDDINCVLCSAGLEAISEPDYVIEWSAADEERKFKQKLPVSARFLFRESKGKLVQAAAKGTDMTSFVLTPRDKENGSSINPDEELKAMKEMDALQTSHVVTHSESQGVYIPLEMKMPLQCEKTHPHLKILGGTVGSSYALLDELIEVAPYLGIHLSADGSLPASEAARLYDISEKAEGDFGQEMTAWLSLHEAAELSITYGTSVVFTPSSS